MIKKKNLKLYVVALLMICCICGCSKNAKDESAPDESSKSKYQITDYDGVYTYNEKVLDNNGYEFYNVGKLAIELDSCSLVDSILVNEKEIKDVNSSGSCYYENDKYYIELKSREVKYECSIDNKNLNCNLISEHGLAGENFEGNNLVFKYLTNIDNLYDLRSSSYYKEFYLSSNILYNMPAGVVEKIVDDYLIEEGATGIIYDRTPSYYNLDSCIYGFDNRKFKGYTCEYKSDIATPYDEYKRVVNLLSVYGQPTENFNWNNESYKDDENKYNAAIEYGYLTITTQWDLGDSAIIINWNYNDKMKFTYYLKGSENFMGV